MAEERSTEDFLNMLRRMMRAAARRVAKADEYELHEFLSLVEDYRYCLGQAVAGQRLYSEKSWAQIAAGTDSTRQAAQMRWGDVEFELYDIEWLDDEETPPADPAAGGESP